MVILNSVRAPINNCHVCWQPHKLNFFYLSAAIHNFTIPFFIEFVFVWTLSFGQFKEGVEL